MNSEISDVIQIGAKVRRRFIKKTEVDAQGIGTVVALGKKYRGARTFPAAKVQFKSTSRVLWYFLDQLKLVPDETSTQGDKKAD
ncbi:hypothetical protein EON83_04255 [bacterium]|nr:MAG: hypothetical protein EON83_04255 [bacterium]